MALSGSLDSFALPDVMRLLASTTKTGRLRVSGDRGSGSIWVVDGEIVASELTSPPSSDPTHAEVLFAMLRFTSGSFSFESNARSVKASDPEQVEPILVSSEHMMIEWRAIEQVVPSLDVYVELASDPGGGDVMVDAARWRCIAAVGGGATVGEVGTKLEQGELEICRTVKELVELGLLVIGEAPTEPEPVPEPVVEAFEKTEAAPEPEPVPEVDSISMAEIPGGDGHGDAATEVSGMEDDAPADSVEETSVSVASESSAADAVEAWNETSVDGPESPDPSTTVETEIEEELETQVDVPVDGGHDPVDGVADPGAMVTTAPGLAGLGSPDEPAFDPEALMNPPVEEGGPGAVHPEVVPDMVPGGVMADGTDGANPGGNEGGGLFGGASPAAADAAAELDPAEMARQLANLSPKAAKAVAAAAKASTEAEREAALAAVEAEDDSVDRGLLLKFLGSVDT